jgi:pilus assembly protein CpaF
VFCILIHEKGGAERREVFEGSEISVGRVQGNELMLPKGNVSKRHARLLCRDGRFIVTDLNSTNGTYVNRRRITQATIVREGDRIYIGDFVLRIEASGAPAEASVAVPVPLPHSPRPPLPTSGDSQPGALLSADEEELTRSPIHAPGRSSPVAAPAPELPVSVAGRATHSDEEPLASNSTLEAAALLVERVARTLRPGELEAELAPELAEKIELNLREAWAALSGNRIVSAELPIERVLSTARSELFELGPLDELLGDPGVSDIAVVGHRRVTLTRAGRSSILESGFTCELSLRLAIARLCKRSGVPLGDEVRVERKLSDGTRLTAVLGQGSGSILHLSRRRRPVGGLDDLVRKGTVSRGVASFLQQCLLARLNLLIVGPRDGGVELLLGALASALPESEVLYTGDLEPRSPSAGPPSAEGAHASAAEVVALAARAPLLRLFTELSESLTEAVIGAISDGADGVVATRYAGSLRRGLLRVLSELRSGHGAGAAELLAGGFEIVIEVVRLRDDRHRVLRVAEVLGTERNELELVDVFTFAIDRTAAGGLIEGSFLPASSMPAIADLMRMRGAPIDSAQFTRSGSGSR